MSAVATPTGVVKLMLANGTVCFECIQPSLFSICSECASDIEAETEADELLRDYIDYEAQPGYRRLSNTCMADHNQGETT